MEQEDWEAAREVLQQQPHLREVVCLPWAQWLAQQDRFDEARHAFV